MNAAPIIAALLLVPAPTAAWAAPAYAPLSGLQCDARAVTGATLAFDLLQMGVGAKPLVIASGKPGGAWIKSDGGIVLLESRSGAREDEYTTGPNLIRIEREGAVRDLTIWSTREGKAFQPVAYGFCVNAKLAAPTAAPAATADSDSLDRGKAADGCHMTTAQPAPWRGPFTASSDVAADRKMVSTFGGLPEGIGALTLNREVLGNGPKAEHRDVALMVGRFFNGAAGTAPSGMDAFYLDKGSRRGTMLVKFDNLDGKGKQAFGICALTVTKVEKP